MVTALGRDYLGTTRQDELGEPCMDWRSLQNTYYAADFLDHILPDNQAAYAHDFCRSTEINLREGITKPSCMMPGMHGMLISSCDVDYCGKWWKLYL